ncbi:MAG: hypothetical protein J2P57_04900 [Acidimicrobiaceae bacterium]|nr:hypothetical protein [Acidimicrobiaceae bacterium]
MTIDHAPATTSEWTTLQQQAEVLAASNYVPRQFKGKPGDIIAVSLMARELGLRPIAALSLIDVIEGSPTLNAEGKVAVVRAQGHTITGDTSAAEAVVYGRRADTGDEMTVRFTLEEARKARLIGKDNWQKEPEDMLWARAVTRLCRRLFSDVIAGLSFDTDQLGPMPDIDGTPQAGGEDGGPPAAVPTPGPSAPAVRRRPPPTATAPHVGTTMDAAGPEPVVESRPQPAAGPGPEPKVSERWVAEARFLVATLGLTDERLADLVRDATIGAADRLEDVPRSLANSVASLLKSLEASEPAGDEYEPAEGEAGEGYGPGEEPW